MLDLESDDQRSVDTPRPEYPEPANQPQHHLVQGFAKAQESISDDDLQTVERVLPIVQNYDVPKSGDDLAGTVTSHPHYIQAVQSKTGAFLRTNLPRTETSRSTETGIAWLLGRSRSCAIVFPDPAVSRCHAVIGHDKQQGFYVMDVGSSNGTFLNQRRLVTMQRYPLTGGDVITISHIKVEMFLLSQD